MPEQGPQKTPSGGRRRQAIDKRMTSDVQTAIRSTVLPPLLSQ